MFKRKLAISSLILSLLLNISCTLSLINTGNISFNLPSSRTASTGNEITFQVMLQNLDDEIVQYVIVKSSQTKTPVLLTDIIAGEYKLIVSGEDEVYKYFGESLVTVKKDVATETEIVLKKEKIKGEEIPQIPENVISTFAELEEAISLAKENDKIVIGKDIEMERQIIIDKPLTIESSRDVTLRRGTSCTNSMFLVNKGPFNLGCDRKVIILDGNKNVVVSLESLLSSSASSEININNCIFQNNRINNTKGTYGGAIYIQNGGTVTIKNSKILNNAYVEKSIAGGGIAAKNATVNIINTSIENNRAHNGGACYFLRSTIEINNNENCHIQNNSAKEYGGGIYMSVGSLNIVNGEINNNTANQFEGNNLCVDSYTYDWPDPILLNGKKVSPGFKAEGPLNKDTIDPHA